MIQKKFKRWKTIKPNSWFSCVPNKNGFLPVDNPLKKLPEKYDSINKILDEMQISKNGYLCKAGLNEKIEDLEILDFSQIEDMKLLAALHRDYCFLASAYSLETSHLFLTESENNIYGEARKSLPPQLAIPLLVLAQKNETFPWLDYAYGYGLNNASLRKDLDPKDHTSYDTIRTFNGNESEKGFINVHVAMVSQSGKLLEYQQRCLECLSKKNRLNFNKNLEKHSKILKSIIQTLQTMWKASDFKDYLSFRTFIMGQIGNKKCYPDENIIFDLDGKTEVHAYRGETGAQDSIIPSVDSFVCLEYPQNKLTEYLQELRKYRPIDHQEYINFMKKSSESLNLIGYCKKDSNTSVILLKNLNLLRLFRKKHWNLTKKYIIQRTKHPVATGGTPITTWLPNQLGATLQYMKEIINCVNEKELTKNNLEFYRNVKLELTDHIQTILDEVYSMQKEFTEQDYKEFTAEK